MFKYKKYNKKVKNKNDWIEVLCYTLLQTRSFSDSLYIQNYQPDVDAKKVKIKLLSAQRLQASYPAHKTNLQKTNIKYNLEGVNHECCC